MDRVAVKLIQHRYLNDPWKMMVACCLLNRTKGDVVRSTLDELFARFPTPLHLSETNFWDVYDIIRHLGFGEQRSDHIISMSQDAVAGKVVGTWKGVGQYAVESWMIFVCGVVMWPEDKELRAYLEWCSMTGTRPPGFAQSSDGEDHFCTVRKRMERGSQDRKRHRHFAQCSCGYVGEKRERDGLAVKDQARHIVDECDIIIRPSPMKVMRLKQYEHNLP